MFLPLRLLPILLLLSFSCFSQEEGIFKPDSIRKEIIAVPITSSLQIDGILNEPEWKLTKPSSPFTQVEPYQGKPPNFVTSVSVLYNKIFLYIGVFSKDSLGRKAIRAIDFKRDFDYTANDLVNITFDAFNDKRNAVAFATNAYGTQRDYLAFDALYYDENWDGLWRVRTSRTDSGWYAEIAIPWQTLRYPATKDSLQSWGFNVYRNRRLTNEITAFSPFPRAFSASRMDYAGVLSNLQPPPPKPNIRVQPYVLSSFNQYKNFADADKIKPAEYKVGGDVKWAINSNSVLDLTANTDFAQADADIQVNNTSRFSVFFPEKRQFFLENASLFSPYIEADGDGSGGSMHIQPFFSRTIGLDSLGNPIPIVGGGRFVHRSAHQNYGAILMRQKETANSPGTNFFVGRYSQNFSEQNRVGGLVTIKDQPGYSNIGSTVDGFFRLSESQSINTMFTQTINTNGTGHGFAGFAQYYKSTNHYKIWFTQSVVTKHFDPEMGFISRTDVVGTTPGINWYYRGSKLPFKKWLRAFEPGFLPEWYFQSSTGKFIEQDLYFFPLWLNFQSGAFLGYGIVPVYQKLTEPFQPLNTMVKEGSYQYFRNWLTFSTDPSKFISLLGDFRWGTYYNGRLTTANWQLHFAPVPHISITAQFNRNYLHDVGVVKENKTVDLYILQARLALNPRVQLIGFYQKNSLDNSQNYYVRFSWEYEPLSYIYLIYNHGGYNNPLQSRQTEDHQIMKLSYLKQF